MKRFGFLFLLVTMFPTMVWAGTCVKPDQTASDRVTKYVRGRYGINPSTELSLSDQVQVSTSCFWKLSYVAGSRHITVYLSPDFLYITPLLYDLNSDPQAEARERVATVAKELTQGEAARRGTVSAPVSIVEFSDFECPFCKRLTDELEGGVFEQEAGKVSIIFRNFPLSMHPWAKDAAELAECARMQRPDAFWMMHDAFFSEQAGIQRETIRALADRIAQSANLKMEMFHSCMDRAQARGAVEQDLELGKKMGVHGTPTLFVNGTLYTGPRDRASLIRMIDGVAQGRSLSDYAMPSVATASPAISPVSNQCAPPPSQTAVKKGDGNAIIIR